MEPLCRHKSHSPRVADWLLGEWPAWYGAGGPGTLDADVAAFAASESRLPVGMLILEGLEPIGFGALRAESIASHKHLTPWATAGFVVPSRRGQGAGSLLLAGLVEQAARLGYEEIHCATSGAVSLLRRAGWTEIDATLQDGERIVIFRTRTMA